MNNQSQDVFGVKLVQLKDAEAAALIRKIAEGDPSALSALYDGTCRLLFGLVSRILGNHTSAEEVLLDAYTQVWRQSASFDSRRYLPLAWLIEITRAQAIVRLRSEKQKPQKQWALAAGPEGTTTAPERQNLVRSAMDSLAPEQRQVLDLACFSGLSCGEIAAQLRQPLATVKTRVWLAMVKLNDLFRPIFDTEK